jgi:hypothetical protein
MHCLCHWHVQVYEFLKRISRKDDAQLHEQRSS